MNLSSKASVEPLRKGVACPTCDRESDRKCYPFCSKRCQEIDLHKWFSGSYAIAGNDTQDFDKET